VLLPAFTVQTFDEGMKSSTALTMKGDEERIRAAGCDGYIAKPMGIQDFLATVAAHLARTGTPDPTSLTPQHAF
jgi:DNA-binding response OmpR family regulator